MTVSERVTFVVEMELESDAIFGSGYSIPGGDDINTTIDEQGYPYLKGSTLKGLLAESLHNLLAWTGGSEEDYAALMGEEGWSGIADERRLQLTDMTLISRPVQPEEAFSAHTFTALENGVVKQGSLRSASCVRAKTKFTGSVTCDKRDVGLLQDAFKGVRWLGSYRNRGFGKVRFTAGNPHPAATGKSLPETFCIHYRLETKLPLIVTDLGRSQEFGYETRGYLPGSAVRGMVMSSLASSQPEWFQEHKAALLEDVRFLDAVPVVDEGAALPSIRGFYEDKAETRFETVVKDGSFTPGFKRAKLGSFCRLEDDTVVYWNGKTGGSLRIMRGGKNEDSRPFQTRHLDAGQTLEGYILLKDPKLAPMIGKVFGQTVWLGADRYEGFGECAVSCLEQADSPEWMEKYGYHSGEKLGTDLYLLAVSPLTMLDEWGNPCGLDLKWLANQLGIENVEICFCATATAEFAGYNRTWKCSTPAVVMYDRGSIFHLNCSTAPDTERLLTLQQQGLGIRKAEGFGQILFLRRELMEGLEHKRAAQTPGQLTPQRQNIQNLRRAKYDWIMSKSKELHKDELSSSQLGTIQALCEKAMANGGSLEELNIYFGKNIERTPKMAKRFQAIQTLVDNVCKTPLSQTLNVCCSDDSVIDRLELLCMLFDYSRKGKKKGER